ncbi:hypothetical protein C8R43DRAFT_993512 [Mycena crocata]|nr:hypothetical protein C8R43DRAFT_993512 [Mycena crocata]
MGNFLVKIAPNSALSTDVYPPSSKFEPERDMPDLSGKIVIVTGGGAGIGYHTVRSEHGPTSMNKTRQPRPPPALFEPR